jgi:hypothetical protein
MHATSQSGSKQEHPEESLNSQLKEQPTSSFTWLISQTETVSRTIQIIYLKSTGSIIDHRSKGPLKMASQVGILHYLHKTEGIGNKCLPLKPQTKLFKHQNVNQQGQLIKSKLDTYPILNLQ